MGAGFVQEVAEVEQGVSGGQELQESLPETTNTQIHLNSLGADGKW